MQKTACLLETDPPYVFPDSFPDESFYFRAVSSLDLGGDRRAVLVLALEAAFANGVPQAGEQMVFTRIRVTAGVPHPGTYRVRHPYGAETFHDVVSAGGSRDIVFSEDIGVTPGEFSQALTSRFGPFLQAVDGQGAIKRVELNGAQFLSDGVSTERVTGGPFGNVFAICGPFDGPGTERCVETDQFTLTGRVHDSVADPIPSPLAVRRASYSRDAGGTRVDVVANASAGIGAGAPLLSAGATGLPPVKLNGPDALQNYYAQAIPLEAGKVPAEVSVVNSGDTPPSRVSRHVVDEVRIGSARYHPDTRQLVVVATSSDKGAGGEAPPVLVLEGHAAQSERGVILEDPASHRFVVEGLAVPPAAVTVASAAGGNARAAVAMERGTNAFAAGVPLALDDTATATAGATTPTVIDVLRNDVVPATAGLTGPVTILDPLQTPMGTLSHTADGKLGFLPTTTTGTATFRYTVANAVGTSNAALLSVSVLPGAGGPVPIANPDPGSGGTPLNVAINSSIVIDVLANDSANDPGGTVTLSPASVTVVTAPNTGTAKPEPDSGRITYTSTETPGTATFAYTVSNTNGNTSAPSTVTVNVLAPDRITVTRARCMQGSRTWDVRGTSSVTNGNSVTLYSVSPVPDAPTASQILAANLPVDALGEFRFQVQNGPACVSPISLKSALGTKVPNIAVQIRN
ncbi:Ig-like domain-containing protein [Caldimonas tepidiphila]|uniref:Ig-like domain-containing protein n=1 Tax=Caldimonas tepidiphila TaxID=2315841 RepID=UPI000E5A743F|nr:Ig-like domain-containing protein [Caldimonas tepidiphila]